MANILSKTGISSGSVVQVGHVTQSIDAFNGTQAYDITLSGSLTVTGSVFLNTTINRDFSGTASFVTTSSTVTSGNTSQYAVSTSYADNETSIIQLYNEQTTLFSSSIYYVGTGTITDTSSSVGFAFPYTSGRIVSASLTWTVLGTTSSLVSTVNLFKNNTKIHDFSANAVYNRRIDSVIDALEITSTASLGDRIYAKFTTSTAPTASNVIHSINLYIKRNG